MSTRATDDAAQFAAINDEVIAAVEGCTAEQWRQPSTSEGWSVAAVAHHIAEANGAVAGMIERLVAADAYTPTTSISADQLHERNAQHARDYAEVAQAEVLDLLRANGTAMVQALHKLDAEHLKRIAGVFGGNELTGAQLVEFVAIGHTAEHGASIRATLSS
jgi:uncharacterized damage-inducible protein DinB